MPGLEIGAALLVLAAAALTWRLMVGPPATRAVVMTMGLALGSAGWVLRPHVLSLLLLAVLIWLLVRERFRIIPLLFVLWANAHGGVVLGGLALAAAAAVAGLRWWLRREPADRRRARDAGDRRSAVRAGVRGVAARLRHLSLRHRVDGAFARGAHHGVVPGLADRRVRRAVLVCGARAAGARGQPPARAGERSCVGVGGLGADRDRARAAAARDPIVSQHAAVRAGRDAGGEPPARQRLPVWHAAGAASARTAAPRDAGSPAAQPGAAGWGRDGGDRRGGVRVRVGGRTPGLASDRRRRAGGGARVRRTALQPL